MVAEFSAIPIEYRYRTDMVAAFIAGLVGIVLLGFLRGLPAMLVGAVAVPALLYGAMGLVADARGLILAAGKRIIITDEAIQEVDEEGRIRWAIRPAEIDMVRTETGAPVCPFTGLCSWRVEYWRLVLKDGREVRVPVWLLPGRGERFRERLLGFLGPARRAKG
ncbi:MAG: hypothetical protein ABIK43_05795 [candidate division WOR-3 bacterium]